MCEPSRLARDAAVVAVLTFAISSCALCERTEGRLCTEGGSFERVEELSLDLDGDGTLDRVTALYRRADDALPVLARWSIGDGPAVLAAPDRLILGLEGSVRADDLAQLFGAVGGHDLGRAADVWELGGGAWLVKVSPAKQAPFILDPPEAEVYNKVPGLALVATLRRRLRQNLVPPLAGIVPRSVSFDRLIPLEPPDPPAGISPTITSPCLARQGAVIAPAATARPPFSTPAAIAVVDSGIDAHPNLTVRWQDAADTSDLAQTFFGTAGSEPCSVACDPPGQGHGTIVAGGAAAREFGVAPNAPLVPVRVFDDEGCGWASSIIRGIYHAVTKADIVVLAWTFSAADRPRCPTGAMTRGDEDEICQAIRESSEALFLAAAGNQGGDLAVSPFYPPAWANELPNLMVVGGVNDIDRWRFNVGRDFIHIAGMATGCQTTIPGNNTDFVFGNSIATGFTAGAAALYRAQNDVSAERVKQALGETARRAGPKSPYLQCCRECGVLDVSNALGLGATVVANSEAGCPP